MYRWQFLLFFLPYACSSSSPLYYQMQTQRKNRHVEDLAAYRMPWPLVPASYARQTGRNMRTLKLSYVHDVPAIYPRLQCHKRATEPSELSSAGGHAAESEGGQRLARTNNPKRHIRTQVPVNTSTPYPRAVPAFTSARRRSPVEICTSPYLSLQT